MMLSLILAALVVSAPPTVNYVVSIETKTWQPIELKDVERILHASATPPLAKTGAIRLAPAAFAELKNADYSLLIQGRFIEEAEKFSVYLTFGPGKLAALPSVHVSNTASIGQRPRTEMQKILEELAANAGQRLYVVLADGLKNAAAGEPIAPIEAEPLPWDWGTIDVPEMRHPSKLVKELLEVTNPDHVRMKAMAELKGNAFDQPVAARALELCMLRDPLPDARIRCAQALEPVARIRTETQRLFLHAMRNELDANVLRVLNTIAGAFVGLSRKETIETWLELVSSDATPAGAASDIAQLLSKEGELPNLDFAVARCLQQESLAWGKKNACAQWLLPNVPKERRASVAWRYLQGIGRGSAGDHLVFDDLTKRMFPDRKTITPEAAELFLSIAERPSAWQVRKSALYLAGQHPKPTVALATRFLKLLKEPDLTSSVTSVLREVGRSDEDVKSFLLGELHKIETQWCCVLCGSRGDPLHNVREAIKALEYKRAK